MTKSNWYIRLLKIFPHGPSAPSSYSQPPPWKRKLRKLQRDPKLFVVDALIKRKLYPKKKSPTISAPPSANEADLMRRIRETGLFDEAFYQTRYPDVVKNKAPALQHYVRYGAREGRLPNAYFDPNHYRKHPGVPSDPRGLLIHYARTGEALGLTPSLQFATGSGVSGQLKLAALLRSARSPVSRSAIPWGVRSRTPRVTVAVPVYNGGLEVILDCLTALVRHTPRSQCEILLMDDASTDPEVVKLLEGFAAEHGARLHRNPTNLGFTRNVNLAFDITQDDVVLLNSDTVVGPGWLSELRVAAYSNPRVATATALSDSAGAFSTPAPGANQTCDLIDTPTAARLSRRAASGATQDVATGNGFCMYIKRAALDEVGSFDAVHFPRGYGEENDWCMRAREHGWRHVIALRSYVRHVNAVSFGKDRKAALVATAREVLDRLHPTYTAAVSDIGKGRALRAQRQRLTNVLKLNSTRHALPRCLFVISTYSGGTPQTNADLMSALKGLYEPWLLVCSSRTMSLYECTSGKAILRRSHELQAPIGFLTHRSNEYDEIIGDWLTAYDVELMHVRHISWHSLGLIEAADARDIPICFSFHDFYCACPSVNLYVPGSPWQPEGVMSPHVISPLWERIDPAGVKTAQEMDGEAFLQMWRRTMSSVLQRCSAFVTTTHSAKAILQANLPLLRERDQDFHVVAHGREFSEFRTLGVAPQADSPMKLLIPGNINEAKGASTIVELTQLDQNGDFEFHVLGNCIAKLHNTRRVIKHGPYTRDEFSDRVAAIGPSVSLILSAWPETFCHTLTESWAAGVPVLGSELGAVGERIKNAAAGWTVTPEDSEAIYEQLLRIKQGAGVWQTAANATASWQQGPEAKRGIGDMAEDYRRIYQSLRRPDRTTGVQPVRLPGRKRVALIAAGTFPSVAPTAYIRLHYPASLQHERYHFSWESCNSFVQEGARDYDAAIICREPGPPAQMRALLHELRRYEIPFIHDIDDDLFSIPLADANDERALAKPELAELLRHARYITTPSAILAAHFADWGETKLLPNLLSRELWLEPLPEEELAASTENDATPDYGVGNDDGTAEIAQDLPLEVMDGYEADAKVHLGTSELARPTRSSGRRLNVLYFGSRTHAEDLSCVLPAFERLRDSGVTLTIVGVERDERDGYSRLTPPSDRYDHFVPWLRKISADFDLGIAPLAASHFNERKSALKFFEYSLCGLPTIASNVEPYAGCIRSGFDGLLVENSVDAWEQALREALEFPERRGSWVAEARARTEASMLLIHNPFAPLLDQMLPSRSCPPSETTAGLTAP